MGVPKGDSETVDLLINKAIELFSEKGYDSATITDLAERLSISRGPIYYHFKDKYGMYSAAYDRFEESLIQIHERAFATDKPLMDQMEELVYEYVIHFSKFGGNFFSLLNELEELQEIRIRFDAMSKELFDDKVRMVEEAQREGVFISSIPAERVVKYVNLVFLSVQNGIDQKFLSPDSPEEIRDLIEVSLHGLKARILNTGE